MRRGTWSFALNFSTIAIHHTYVFLSHYGVLRIQYPRPKDVMVKVHIIYLAVDKLKGPLKIVSSSAEFENVFTRRHAEILLRRVLVSPSLSASRLSTLEAFRFFRLCFLDSGSHQTGSMSIRSRPEKAVELVVTSFGMHLILPPAG